MDTEERGEKVERGIRRPERVRVEKNSETAVAAALSLCSACSVLIKSRIETFPLFNICQQKHDLLRVEANVHNRARG